jgi:hypothetical protein
MRHGCLVAWNNGDHPGVSERLPADFNEWTTAKLTRFALDKSYPAFSNCSRDGDPGDGDNNDGDIVGSINRGLDWTEPRETADRYEVLITYDLAPADLPLSVDVTPRRCPIFKLDPGQACSAVNIDSRGRTIQATRLKADRLGLATFRQFQVTGKEGNRLVLKK